MALVVADEFRKDTDTNRAPVKLKDGAKLTSKSESHLRNEVNAGRLKRVSRTSNILIPWAEIERMGTGELISK